jgi:uncharacterized protein (DUF4415 family)
MGSRPAADDDLGAYGDANAAVARKAMKKEYDFKRGRRGPVAPTPPDKTRITIRIDDDVLEWFSQQVHATGGGNYQTLMNAALREHVSRRVESLEDIPGREELQ